MHALMHGRRGMLNGASSNANDVQSAGCDTDVSSCEEHGVNAGIAWGAVEHAVVNVWEWCR